MAELLRALAALAEEPGEEHARLAELLDLPGITDSGEYSEVFIFQLYPYASVYLGPEGMIGGEARSRIAGFWTAVGHEVPSEPDHLSALLALYATLREAGEGEKDRAQALMLRQAGDTLLWEHLLSWLPIYLDRFSDVEPPLYQRWAELLARVLEDEAARFPWSGSVNPHLEVAPPLSDPREGGLDPFLDSLLAPARSGMILTRNDLVRAAVDLETGVRAGERRFVLKALLGADASALLEWLARFLVEQLTLRDTRSGVSRVAIEPWNEKARAARSLLVELAAVL